MLPANTLAEGDGNSSLLLQSFSITKIEELLQQMRIKEIPKRSLFSIPFHLAEGFTVGVKGCVFFAHLGKQICNVFCRYGLVTEQKKGSYRVFYDAGDQLEPVSVKSMYVDEVRLADRHLLID